MKCCICGCSPLSACMTEDGPCHWADPGLCSACVGAACVPDDGRIAIVVFGSIEEQAVMAEMRRMVNGPRMPGR